MAVTIHERAKYEIIFQKDGKNDGVEKWKVAPYCFVEVAVGKNFVTPAPMYNRFDRQRGSNFGAALSSFDIVKIHFFEERMMPFGKTTKLMSFGDV